MHAGVMTRLKTETAERHKAAGRRMFQRRLISGGVSTTEYARWLGQLLTVHRGLEPRLRAAAAADPRIGAVITAEQYHEQDLVDDLACLGAASSAIDAGPGARLALERIDRASAVELLGMHYVLEGSANGNRIIAKALRRSLGLKPGHADHYLDPYGTAQREKWAAFKAAMDTADWTPADEDALVAAAAGMFDVLGILSAELQGE